MCTPGGLPNLGCKPIWFLLLLSCATIQGAEYWERPGCHLTGRTRIIDDIPPGCPPFELTSNACYGYCESSARPTSPEALLLNPQQTITSVARCCDMDETRYITVSPECENGIQHFTFKEAITCSCSQCKKD